MILDVMLCNSCSAMMSISIAVAISTVSFGSLLSHFLYDFASIATSPSSPMNIVPQHVTFQKYTQM